MPDIFDQLAATPKQAAQPAGRDIFDDLIDGQKAVSRIQFNPTSEQSGLIGEIKSERSKQAALGQPFASVQPNGRIIQSPPQNDSEANSAEFNKIFKTVDPIPNFKISPKDSPLVATGKEAVNLLKSVPDFMLSGAGLLSLPLGGVAPKTVMGLFSADALKNAGTQIYQAHKDWDNYTPAQKMVAVTDVGGELTLAGLLGHGIKENLATEPNIFDSPEGKAIKQFYSQVKNQPISAESHLILPETKRGENNAIPIRSSTQVPLGETPEDSGKVGARIPEPETPAEAQTQRPLQGSPPPDEGTAPAGNVAATVTPPLQQGERIVTVKRADGSTYEAAFADKFYDHPKRGQVPSLARLKNGEWSHGMLDVGETILPESPSTTEGTKNVPESTGVENPPVAPAQSSPLDALRAQAAKILVEQRNFHPDDAAKYVKKLEVGNAKKNLTGFIADNSEQPTPQPTSAAGKEKADYLNEQIKIASKQNKELGESRVAEAKRVVSLPDEEFRDYVKNWERSTTKENEPTPIGQGPVARTKRGGEAEFMPGEKPESYDATGLKHSIDEFERAVYGFPEAEPAEKRQMIPQWIKSAEVLKADPGLPERIVTDLTDNPKRALTDLESAVLLRYKNGLENAMNDAAEKSLSETDPSEKNALQLQIEVLRDKLEDFLDAVRGRGTEWGREGRWRQALVKEDYSFATQERLLRAVRPDNMTDAQFNKEVEKLQASLAEHKRINDQITKELADKDKKIVELEAQKAMDEAFKIKVAATPPVEPHVKIIADRIKGYFDKRAEDALKRINGRVYSISPGLIADLTDLGVSTILKGAIELGEWTAEMTAKFSKDFLDKWADQIDLADIFKRSNAALDEESKKVSGGKISGERVKKVSELTPQERQERVQNIIRKRIGEGKTNTITPLIRKLMRYFVEQGVKDRGEMLARVHGFLQSIVPDITENQTMRIMSGYGDFRPLPKDEVSKTIRDLNGQYQLVLQAESLKAGEPREKTGQERREVTHEQRKLQKVVNDLNREFQVPQTDPETQLKSPLDTLKTRIKNRIADLQEILENGDFSSKPPKQPLKLDAHAIEMQGKLRSIERQVRDARIRLELQNRSFTQRLSDWLVNFHRLGVISGLTTLGKLGLAGQGRIGMTIADTTAGLFLNKMPFIRDIAKKAPREGLTGGDNFQKIAQGYVDGWKYAAAQAAKVISKGQSGAEEAARARNIYDVPLGKYLYFTHALAKLPAFSQEYKISLLYHAEAASKLKNGEPLAAMEELAVNNQAVDDGLRAKFNQDNILTKRLQMVLRSLETSKEHPTTARIIANTIRFILPVTHIPMNVAAEGMTYNNLGLGLPRALEKTFGAPVHAGVKSLASEKSPQAAYNAAMDAFAKSIEELTPKQADSIMRHWKKGSIGAGLMLLGYYNADNIGGYYQPGKQDPNKPEFGGIRIYGHNIPRWMIHLPIFEPLHFGATIKHVIDHVTKKTGQHGSVAEGVTAGMAGMLDEVPYVSQARNVTEILAPGGQGKYARGELVKSAVVPNLISQIAQWSDKNASGNPVKREPKTVLQHIETGIPGLRQTVPKKNPLAE